MFHADNTGRSETDLNSRCCAYNCTGFPDGVGSSYTATLFYTRILEALSASINCPRPGMSYKYIAVVTEQLLHGKFADFGTFSQGRRSMCSGLPRDNLTTSVVRAFFAFDVT